MSSTPSHRILVVQDNATLALLHPVLAAEGHQVIEALSVEQALDLAMNHPIDLAIVESTMPDIDGYDLCRQLRAMESTRDLPILMLSFNSAVADKIAGFEAGINDYVVKPFQPEELIYRVRLLLAQSTKRPEFESPPTSRGHIVALFGTKGGVGRTTISVNLGIALQRRAHCKVALFDADFFFGDMALHLNVSPSRTILDLIERMNNMDLELIDQVLVTHPSGVRVLLSPRNPEEVEAITASHIERLLDFLALSYDYVIVDCQASYNESMLVILEKSDTILLVIKPEVGCVKNMAVFSELAAKLGLSFNKKIHIILNRSGSKSGIGPKEIERIFRRQIGFHIGSAGNTVAVSINRGVPLMLEHPSHPFSLQVSQIADYLIRNMPPGIT